MNIATSSVHLSVLIDLCRTRLAVSTCVVSEPNVARCQMRCDSQCERMGILVHHTYVPLAN